MKHTTNTSDVDVQINQLIGDQWSAGQGEETLELTSPIDGRRLGAVPSASGAQIDTAIAAAQQAGRDWARRSPFDRAEVLLSVGAEIERRKEEIARALSLEQGKPYHSEAIPEIDDLLSALRNNAGDVTRLETPVLPSPDPHKRVLTVRAPLGVVAVISPWNYPTLPALQAFPAIAVGNAVVCKPSEVTPWTAQLLGEAILAGGLPPGVFNLVQGAGRVGEHLITHPGVSGIYFVGSSATAERIVKAAGLKRTLIEASGNGPVIVCADGDIQKAAEALTIGSLWNAGQVCTSTGRVLVERSVHDELLAAVVEQAKGWPLGNPLTEGTAVGPMAHLPTAERVRAQLDEALQLGADLAFRAPGPEGVSSDLYVPPTVLGNVSPQARVHHEETFGPVIPLVAFDDDDEALELAAMSELGLQGAVFTSSLRRAFHYAENLRLGATVVNDGTFGALPPIPYGGAAGSRTGWGKVGGRFELEDLSDLRVVALDIS